MVQTADQQIILIDEDDIVRDSLKVLLESHGMQVRDFRCAAEFLAQSDISRGGCLVLGHNRLIADGLKLMETLRRRSGVLPAIFIVGGGVAATKAAAIAAGAFAYLERPIEEIALIRTIRAALACKSAWNAPGSATAAADRPITLAPARS